VEAVMDIVYLVKVNEKSNGNDLRYSLRSLKNIPHDKVVIVGEKPDWITNVTYIPVPQTDVKKANIENNLKAAIQSDLVSDNFVLMNDDFYIMKPISEIPNYNFGLMLEVIAMYDKRYPEGSDYMDTMKKQYSDLLMDGYERPLSYELHIPMNMNKLKAQAFFAAVNKPVYQFRSYYSNYVHAGGSTVPDVKVFLEPRHNDPAYNANPLAYLENQTFLSVTGGSFKNGISGEFIKSKFSSKSDYEK
jgi:hypothetical protein